MAEIFGVLHTMFQMGFYLIPKNLFVIGIPFLAGMIIVKAVKSI